MTIHPLNCIDGFLMSCVVFSCRTNFPERRHDSPVHALYETAGTLGHRNLEISGSYTNTRSTGQNSFGQSVGSSNVDEESATLRVGYGISSKVDIKVRFAYSHLPGRNYPPDPAFTVERKRNYFFSLVPKVSLTKEKLALALPINFYDYESSQPGLATSQFRQRYVSFAPHLIRTFSLKAEKIDFSAAVNTEIALYKDDYNSSLLAVYSGFNINSGLSSNLSRWAIRPELGYQFKLWDEKGFWNVGTGLQVFIPTKRK